MQRNHCDSLERVHKCLLRRNIIRGQLSGTAVYSNTRVLPVELWRRDYGG